MAVSWKGMLIKECDGEGGKWCYRSERVNWRGSEHSMEVVHGGPENFIKIKEEGKNKSKGKSHFIYIPNFNLSILNSIYSCVLN